MTQRLEDPVFIISMPRSGSTLLYNVLGGAREPFTTGGESHRLIETLPGLHPRERGWTSNRLTEQDATPAIVAEMTARFLAAMANRDGRRPEPSESPIFLEKTPKNILRVPFFAAAYPTARFIYLHREPIETISSMLEGWRLPPPRFKGYPDLPGWTGHQWTFLLIPQWRDLIGVPLAEVVVAQWLHATNTVQADLDALEPNRWCSIGFSDLLTYPKQEVTRICDFLGWTFDHELPDPLPLSGSQVSPPTKDKWRANAHELAPAMAAANLHFGYDFDALSR
jgi:hypothetical protein